MSKVTFRSESDEIKLIIFALIALVIGLFLTVGSMMIIAYNSDTNKGFTGNGSWEDPYTGFSISNLEKLPGEEYWLVEPGSNRLCFYKEEKYTPIYSCLSIEESQVHLGNHSSR